MKFTYEVVKSLRAVNDDGTLAILQEGDEVYLKLDLPYMNLYDKDKWIVLYPDGWIKGKISNISNAGKKITFKVCNNLCTHIILNQVDILQISDKAPKE